MKVRTGLVCWILVWALSGGCFGSCGGCSGDGAGSKLFKSLKAIDEAGGGAISKASDEAALEPAEEEAGSAGQELSARINDPRLKAIDAQMLRERFQSHGYKLINCSEGTSDDEFSLQLECSFVRKAKTGPAQVVQVQMMEYRHRDLYQDELPLYAHSFGVQLAAGMRTFRVLVSDKKFAREVLKKALVREAIPSAQQAEKALESLGLQVMECERETDGQLELMECEFGKGGQLHGTFELSADAEHKPDDYQGRWAEEFSEGKVLGHTEATVMVDDLAAARALVRKLFPELLPADGQVLLSVSLEDEKHNGKGWDVGYGLPDPFVVVDGTSYRKQRCKNNLDCTFIVKGKGSSLHIEIKDADAASDDPAGSVDCPVDDNCEFRDGTLLIRSIW